LLRQIKLLIASGFYSGYAPFASGTWGSLVAIGLYWPFAAWNRLPSEGGLLWAYFLVVVAVSVLGVWTADYAEGVYGEKDPGRVVIDEIAGFFIAMILVPWDWRWIAAAFFVFRAFDVWKPYPIRGLQRLRGGWGIVVDDLLAGAYTCIVLHAARLTVFQ
jgi:phosphatidylglycerophosphatase A